MILIDQSIHQDYRYRLPIIPIFALTIQALRGHRDFGRGRRHSGHDQGTVRHQDSAHSAGGRRGYCLHGFRRRNRQAQNARELHQLPVISGHAEKWRAKYVAVLYSGGNWPSLKVKLRHISLLSGGCSRASFRQVGRSDRFGVPKVGGEN